MLAGKSIRRIARHREGEILIEMIDGKRLLVDSDTALELSIHATR